VGGVSDGGLVADLGAVCIAGLVANVEAVSILGLVAGVEAVSIEESDAFVGRESEVCCV